MTTIDSATMKKEIRQILQAQSHQLGSVTARVVRNALEGRLRLKPDELEGQKGEIAACIKDVLQEMEEANVKPEPTADGATSFSALAATSSSSSTTTAASQQKLNASKKRALDAAAGDEEEFDELDEPGAKRTKGANGSSSSSNSNGDGNIQLGGNKRVSVSKFKQFVLIDIRETYTDKTSGEERPGKKGIALKPEQWELLLKNAGKINAAIAKLQ